MLGDILVYNCWTNNSAAEDDLTLLRIPNVAGRYEVPSPQLSYLNLVPRQRPIFWSLSLNPKVKS